MTENLDLTPSAFGVLDAILAGKGVSERRRAKPDALGAWERVRSTGSFRTLLNNLRDRGLITRFEKAASGEPYEPKANELTAKGLRAMEAYFVAKQSGRRFDPTDGTGALLAKVRELLPAREAFEVAKEARKTADKDASNAHYAKLQDARRQGHLDELKLRLVKHGFVEFVESKTDDELLAFASDIEGAEHGKRNLRYLDDDALSRELETLEKTGVVPGSIGDAIRSEGIAAIRAEFVRRAEGGE